MAVTFYQSYYFQERISTIDSFISTGSGDSDYRYDKRAYPSAKERNFAKQRYILENWIFFIF